MFAMSVTRPTFQFSKGWLKARAWKNMPDMSVTWETFHPSRGWLKARAS